MIIRLIITVVILKILAILLPKLMKFLFTKIKRFILQLLPQFDKSLNYSIFVGIVAAPQINGVSIGIVDIKHQTVASQSFPIAQSSFPAKLESLQKISHSSDLDTVGKFLASHISNSRIARVLIEIPSAILDANSIYVKLLFYLAQQRYCGFEVKVIEEQEKVQLRFPYIVVENQEGSQTVTRIPEQFRLNAPVKQGVLYLQQNISQAYAQFLLGNSPSEEVAAIAAALIAENPSLYYFFTSEGQVQSSQDLVMYMNLPQEEPTAVISADEVYITAKTPLTISERIDKIHLHYAVAKKKNNFLSQNDALKFALLAVCKVWKIRLSCISSRDEYAELTSNVHQEEIEQNLNKDFDDYTQYNMLILQPKYVIYDPERELDLWIVNAFNASKSIF